MKLRLLALSSALVFASLANAQYVCPNGTTKFCNFDAFGQVVSCFCKQDTYRGLQVFPGQTTVSPVLQETVPDVATQFYMEQLRQGKGAPTVGSAIADGLTRSRRERQEAELRELLIQQLKRQR